MTQVKIVRNFRFEQSLNMIFKSPILVKFYYQKFKELNANKLNPQKSLETRIMKPKLQNSSFLKKNFKLDEKSFLTSMKFEWPSMDFINLLRKPKHEIKFYLEIQQIINTGF